MTRTSKISFILLFALLLVPFAALAQKTYVVSVGLSNYAPNNPCSYLPSSVGDAKGISKFFKNYNNADVFMLIDSNATRDHILRVLRSQFGKANENDAIIFAYSGHGFDGGITGYNGDGAGGSEVVYCAEIQDIMRQSKASKKVMFVHSCHAGSFKKKYADNPRARNYKAQDSTVLLYLSSASDEESWSYGGWENSFFYHYLLKGFRGAADANGDRKVTARELFNYVNREVIDITNGIQHPQMFGNFRDDMVVVNVK